MAFTVTNPLDPPGPIPYGDRFMTLRHVVPDSAWTALGESLTYGQLGFSKAPDWVEVQPNGGYVAEYDITNQLLLVYWVDTSVDGAALAAVVDNTNLSGRTFVVKAYGKYAA